MNMGQLIFLFRHFYVVKWHCIVRPILNLSRAWQPLFLSHTLEILVSSESFIDKQMMFYKFFCIFNRKAKISKKLIFDKPEVPMTVHIRQGILQFFLKSVSSKE